MLNRAALLCLFWSLGATLGACVASGTGGPGLHPSDTTTPRPECADKASAARPDSAAVSLQPLATLPERTPGRASEQLALELNVPAYRLDVREAGVVTRSYTVSVGSPGFPTPRGSFLITDIVWNPWWHPPSRDWARGMTPAPPGADNPMGWVKINFRPLYFIHGTPVEESLGRAASHGCVRMANDDAIALARILHRVGTPDLTPSQLDRLERNPRRTETIVLRWPVPLDIVYDLAEVRDDTLRIYPDVYGARPRLTPEHIAETLSRAGYPVQRLDYGLLTELVARARKERISIRIEALSQNGPAAERPRP
jgi:murein L,D-transpeptidase YcbB/YkuD